mmetsp:Transcript_5317/g.14386  ORF Transcript_5317/g.14386 Transcript_5317/m.14386 type:complete len:309 (+) Transcript_5317:408-1334(+)
MRHRVNLCQRPARNRVEDVGAITLDGGLGRLHLEVQADEQRRQWELGLPLELLFVPQPGKGLLVLHGQAFHDDVGHFPLPSDRGDVHEQLSSEALLRGAAHKVLEAAPDPAESGRRPSRWSIEEYEHALCELQRLVEGRLLGVRREARGADVVLPVGVGADPIGIGSCVAPLPRVLLEASDTITDRLAPPVAEEPLGPLAVRVREEDLDHAAVSLLRRGQDHPSVAMVQAQEGHIQDLARGLGVGCGGRVRPSLCLARPLCKGLHAAQLVQVDAAVLSPLDVAAELELLREELVLAPSVLSVLNLSRT